MSDDSDPDYVPDSDTTSSEDDNLKTQTIHDNSYDYKDKEDQEDEEDEEDQEEEDEEDEEDQEEDEEEEDEEDRGGEVENNNNGNKIMFFINSNSNPLALMMNNKKTRKRRRSQKKEHVAKKMKYNDIISKYNKFERSHFEQMKDDEKEEIYTLEKNLEKSNFQTPEPLRFKFLRLNLADCIKNMIISKLEQLNKMPPCSGEYFKLSNWIKILSTIPIGKYHTLPIKNTDSDIAHYLQGIKKSLDDNIYGHEETKDQIVRILAQWISNPKSNGYVIGIQGSPGVGKTKLIKEGICKAMGYPFAFISLGGISDASFLSGHHYTYEGSTHGKIIESLIKARVMNPVFLFDELDKVSNTSRGDEIINTLIHITDPVQNDKFSDKFFEELDLDLSKSLIIFTYNDENAINPILRDRMITIKVAGYNNKQKLTICNDYIIPELLPQYNMKKGDIVFDEQLLKHIIELYAGEEVFAI
jgi:ATP-dependent Lon protease